MPTDFRERGMERERERETSISRPDRELSPQPRCVPQPGTELQPFSVGDDALTNRATLAGQDFVFTIKFIIEEKVNGKKAS